MNPTKVRFVSGHFYSSSYFPTSQTKKIKSRWLEGKEFYEAIIGNFKRIVTPVIPFGVDKTFMMDVVTGTMYDISTGRCLSSDVLVMSKFIKKKGLKDRLMNYHGDLK